MEVKAADGGTNASRTFINDVTEVGISYFFDTLYEDLSQTGNIM